MKNVGEAIVPDSVRISSDINKLESSFDPAKPFTMEVEYETMPPIRCVRSRSTSDLRSRQRGGSAGGGKLF